MNKIQNIVLVGNCPEDKQESMLRFECMLRKELQAIGLNTVSICAKFKLANIGGHYSYRGWRKWAGYYDKHVSFPRQLRKLTTTLSKETTAYHIIDHSNATYGRVLHDQHWTITCHDLLAVRGALGDKGAYCETSRTGSVLQKWILRSLDQAQSIACVSKATQSDLFKLTRHTELSSSVIPLGVNSPFHVISPAECENILINNTIKHEDRYVLMVGSALPRKNRETALAALKIINHTSKYKLVIAGQPLSEPQRALARSLGILDDIIEIIKPNFTTLNALYNKATALIFPSYAEGFGWPIIEAQTCHCPVICSDQTSVPEVAGNGALICRASNPTDFALALLSLESNTGIRHELICRGQQNLSRFSTSKLAQEYLKLYNTLHLTPK